MVRYLDLDETEAFRKLLSLPKPRLEALLTADRVASCDIPMGGGLTYNWAASPVDAPILGCLGELAAEQGLVEKYRELAAGAVMNTGRMS